ncbi:PTS transporter subunit EIIB [Candidatus Galacturonibacter soehngenii]|uniref:PTS fructose transporter subunit IIB n=1 Tax=Candidatus Galacturonatibacter soehngenii TaxID=2307010 RepID=A0A7V7QLK0_9FIRM|nr:PTS transporter subunit EIIB [Candidatus Galacturonibacter soehngenii]KAB1439390.1 hypothetical protein F7O84_03045 [Candidatus Galacturonibacter soehngenii]
MGKKDTYNKTAKEVLQAVGGKDNVIQVTHCMTRLRFNLKDDKIPNQEKIKQIDGVAGVVQSGGQYQVIIGTTVEPVYAELIQIGGFAEQEAVKDSIDQKKEKLSPKSILGAMFDYLSGSLTPLIPILLVASLCRTVAAVLGPQLIGAISEESSLYILFTFVGDAGFYFLPIFIGYSAAKKRNCSIPIGMLLGAVLIHPTLINMVTNESSLHVYGIPAMINNYASTVIPMILIIWAMSYVEKFFKKYSPDVLKVFLVPFGTLIVMLPLSLCVLAPAGAFFGTYICNAIISVNSVAGPLGVAIACAFKFKKRENRTLTISYIITWFIGGVGEPLLYGLNVPYKTPLYASAIAGFITGLVAGFLNLTAYILSTSNGIYLIPAFVGGSTSNYIALGVTLLVGLASGFIVMYFMKLEEK